MKKVERINIIMRYINNRPTLQFLKSCENLTSLVRQLLEISEKLKPWGCHLSLKLEGMGVILSCKLCPACCSLYR